jgi:hypothetical protein
MTPYQRCPFCDVVVEIDSNGHDALKRHIRAAHDERRTAQDRAA